MPLLVVVPAPCHAPSGRPGAPPTLERVRIPDGDLVPRRRRSRYGGGYGRRRRRLRGYVAVVVVLLLAVGLVYWYALRDETPVVLSAAEPCPTPSAQATPAARVLPAPSQVRLALLNGTPRNGLAKSVGTQLEGRGFAVVSEGNASAALGGASTVTYGPGALDAATVLSRHVLGSRLVSAPQAPAGRVVLVLGGDFRRLATTAEAAGPARSVSPQAVVPAPTRSPCAA